MYLQIWSTHSWSVFHKDYRFYNNLLSSLGVGGLRLYPVYTFQLSTHFLKVRHINYFTPGCQGNGGGGAGVLR